MKDRVTRKGRQLLSWRPSRGGGESLAIAQLIAPFRYDVLVRARFFDFLAEHAGAGDDELVAAAYDEPYHVWFTDIECARFFPQLLLDLPAQRERFTQRVLGARRLLHSFEANGFDPSSPIGLIEISPPGRTDSGLPVAARYHLGDGCHRAALLLRAGIDLGPSLYRVRHSSAPVLDNTARLAPSLDISDADYAGFVSPAFSSEPVGSTQDLRRTLVATAPGRAAELDALMRVHGR